MKKELLLSICLAGLGLPVRAGSALTLKEALSIAQRDNPEITAARKKWESAQSRTTQRYTPDKPRLDLERMYVPRDKDIVSGAEEKNISITQELPFPTTLLWQGKQASFEAKAEEAGLRAVEIDVASRVKVAYALLAQSHHHRHIMEENIALMKQFSRTVEAKYAVGRGTQAEALKANLELARMENDLIDLAQEEETARALLNFLLNRPTEQTVEIGEMGVPKPLDKSFDTLLQEALANRPEIKEADMRVKAGRAGHDAARSEFLPDLMLQYRRRDRIDGADSQDAILGMSLPIWFWKQGAAMHEAGADLEMAEAEQRFAANMTGYEIKEALTKFKSSLRLVQLYEKGLIPQAQQARRASESAYRAGRGSFIDLLDVTRTVLSFQQDYYHAITDSWKAIATLERLVGTELEEVPQ